MREDGFTVFAVSFLQTLLLMATPPCMPGVQTNTVSWVSVTCHLEPSQLKSR